MSTGLFKYLHNSQEELNILLNDSNTTKLDLADIYTAIGYIEYFKNNIDGAILNYETAKKLYMELQYDNKIAFCQSYLAFK